MQSRIKKHSDGDGVAGNSEMEVRNDRGDRLTDFANSNQLAIINIMSEKHPRGLYTWTSPDGITKN